MRQETGCAPFALSTSGWELEKMRMAARPFRDVMGGGGCLLPDSLWCGPDATCRSC